jgi:hypothetical protein
MSSVWARLFLEEWHEKAGVCYFTHRNYFSCTLAFELEVKGGASSFYFEETRRETDTVVNGTDLSLHRCGRDLQGRIR